MAELGRKSLRLWHQRILLLKMMMPKAIVGDEGGQRMNAGAVQHCLINCPGERKGTQWTYLLSSLGLGVNGPSR